MPAVGCREKAAPPKAPGPNPPLVEKGESPAADGDFVGLDEGEGAKLAKARKLASRVVSVDGEPRPGTKDYRPDRVNFEVENGKIVRVTRG